MKKLRFIPVTLFLLFYFYKTVFAAFTQNITSINPNSVTSKDQEVTVNVSLLDLPSESYFRAEWQQSSGSTYVGYSKNNNGDWVKVDSNQDCASYFKVSDTSTTSIVLSTKIGNDNDVTNGNYSIKVRRYTATCSSSSDSDPATISINLPTPAPTSTPNPTTTATPTSAPTVAPTPVKTLTPKPKATSTPSNEPSSSPEVLGESTQPTQTPTPSSTAVSSTASNIPVIPIILVGLGVISIVIALFPILKNFYLTKVKGYNGNTNENPQKPA